MMSMDQKTRDMIIGLLGGVAAGALVGVTLGLLFAPFSGEDLRTQLRERAQYVQDEVQRARDERRAEMEQQLADMRAVRRPSTPTM